MLPSSSSSSSSRPARSRSWGAGPWTTPPLSPRQTKPRHERSCSATPTYSPPPPPVVFSDSESEGPQARGAGEQVEEEEGVRPATMQTEDPKERVRHLEREVASAKQTEMKMLESLVRQTKDLEQAKIALEEARLELATLRQQHQASGAEPAAAHQPQQWSVMDLVFGGVDEEINGLRSRLRAAVQAEERSRKAADELAAAMSAVTMEAKQVKAWLADAQAQAEAAAAEADRLGGLLQGAEAELWAATEQVDALTSQWKDAAAGWRAREKALLARARAAKEDAAGLAADLELARAENDGLRDAAAEAERAAEALRREKESLEASEAAARDRARELEGQLAEKAAAELPLVDKWRREAAQGKLGAAAFLDSAGGRVIPGRKDRMFASLSNLAELKSAAAAAAAMDDYDYEFDHLDAAADHAMKHDNKRRSILRKFGDLFRRRSMYKPNLAPVLHNHY